MIMFNDQNLYLALKELDIIPVEELEQIFKTSQAQHLSLAELLLKKDLISDDNLGKIIADLTKIPYIRLSNITIPDDILHLIPEIVAKRQKIIIFKKDQTGLHLALSNPGDLQIREFIRKKLGSPINIHYATERDIIDTCRLYSKNVIQTFDEIIKENIDQFKSIKGEQLEPPIIKIVDTILTYAYQNKASDIHIEPQDDNSLVRFRIDGILHDIVTLPLNLHNRIVIRVKVIAKLRIDEHHAAQDGKFQFKTEYLLEPTGYLDIRVSVVPITKGEKIVMRLLSERSRRFSLDELGFSEADFTKIKQAYLKPYGMILATGPTGSGKTTTMYAVIKLLNKREVNIATIEDPVEYEIEGINQIQVNPLTNLNFASGLKSILRQDPNIILVGEIRDQETAGIALNAAMTGHLVLSTLHTNDAATAIPRLLDMKVEPYLIASTINLIIAQRLVRKIHLGCRISQEIELSKLEKHFSQEIIKKFFDNKKEKSVRVYYGKGCPLCHQTGYEGRVGIFEILIVDEVIRKVIVNRQDASEIKKTAISRGMKTMIEDALEKVKQGITSLDEVLRVTKE